MNFKSSPLAADPPHSLFSAFLHHLRLADSQTAVFDKCLPCFPISQLVLSLTSTLSASLLLFLAIPLFFAFSNFSVCLLVPLFCQMYFQDGLFRHFQSGYLYWVCLKISQTDMIFQPFSTFSSTIMCSIFHDFHG